MVFAMFSLEGRCAQKSKILKQRNIHQPRRGFRVVSQEALIAGIINAIFQTRNQELDRAIGTEVSQEIDEIFTNIFSDYASAVANNLN